MLTYADLKNTYHTEKKTSSLSKLNNNFYSAARDLIAQVDDLHGAHLSKILSEVYELRKNKIMLAAARSHKPENLITAEVEMYDEIVNKLENFRNNLLHAQTEIREEEKIKEVPKREIQGGEEKLEIKPEALAGEKREKREKHEKEKIKIRIMKNVPAIIGSDLKHYELMEGDEVVMPEIDANILIENEIAVRI